MKLFNFLSFRLFKKREETEEYIVYTPYTSDKNNLDLTDEKFKGLKTLKGFPKKIKKPNCSDNKLTSLKGCPKIVGGNILCLDNKLTALKHVPKNGF